MRVPLSSVYIVSPATDSRISTIKYETAFASLAPLALGTWLQERLPDVEVIARDGNILGQDAILAEIARRRPSVVAVSTLGMNYQNCLEIARSSKEIGAIVVFGNDHAAQLSHAILTARPFVDYVICSEYGELPFEFLLRHLSTGTPSLEEIPFLTYRDESGEVHGYVYPGRQQASNGFLAPYTEARKGAELDSFPITNRKLYPDAIWQSCLDAFRQQTDMAFVRGEVTGVATMNRARGCSRAKRPCTFCNIFSLDPRVSSPEMFWAEILRAHQDVAATVLYEVCDSFTSFPSFIRKLLAARPRDLRFEPQLIVYGQALEIVRHSSLPSMLKDLGVFKVNLGLESGSDTTLRHMKGPDDSVEVNRQALEALHSAGLRTYASFVLGSEAETAETLVETKDWILSIMDDDLVDDIEIQPVLPYIGNREGELLQERGLFQIDPDNPDWPPDTDALSRVFIDNASGVSYAMVCEVVDQTTLHARKLGKTGCSAVMQSPPDLHTAGRS